MEAVFRLLALSLFWVMSIFHPKGQARQHTVQISNLGNREGDLYIGWYTNEKDFRKTDKAVFQRKIKVREQSAVEVHFYGINSGKYAIAVFLDENSNYYFDRNFLEIPTKKYGFSNNVLPALRPATFPESSFTTDSSNSLIAINLK